MTQQNTIINQLFISASMGIHMLQGAAVALFAIILFLQGAGTPDPSWGSFWMLKPLLIVPVAGAVGGILYYALQKLSAKGGWTNILTLLIGLAGYIIILWLGIVLGLNGTMWD